MHAQEKQAALKEEVTWHVEQRARDRSGGVAAAAAEAAPTDAPQRAWGGDAPPGEAVDLFA